MDKWLSAALDYIPRWIEHQMRIHEQPGCSFALVQHGKLAAEFALGQAAPGVALTPRHRFRVASHSKTFTAVAVMKLREQARCGLDDPVGRFVPGLHPDVAAATLAQLLSHSAGLVRDGADAGQWADRRPFLNEAELRADLASGPLLPTGSRFKYSNHGYGLLGLAIEAITGEPYAHWVAREVVAASVLKETVPDAPLAAGLPFVRLARGHSTRWPLGQRVVIPGDNPTHALAAATGFISTAADLARFFASLAPDAPCSVLTPASRREMLRRQWRDPHGTAERWYGLGTISATLADWDHFGHSGTFQGTLTRTLCVPAQGLALSVLTNAADGLAQTFADGALHILRAHARHGAPTATTRAWRGRWWSLSGAFDLVPLADRVLVASPALANPLQDASEITLDTPSTGRITLAGGFANHGEPARLKRAAAGRPAALQLGGTRLQDEAATVAELKAKYQAAR